MASKKKRDWWINGAVAYQAFATIPTKGTTTVLTLASNGISIANSELLGNTDVEILADYGGDKIAFDVDADGTVGTPNRFFLNGNTIGGALITTGDKVLQVGDYWEVYGGVLEGDDSAVDTGIIGISRGPSTTGLNQLYQDLVIKDMYFAGTQLNTTDGSKYYQELSFVDIRVFGHPAEGEGFYVGNTAKPAQVIVRNTYGRNVLVTNKGREGLQLNSIVPSGGDYGVDYEYVTCFDTGLKGESGQWYSFQVQNASGYIKHSIFDTSVRIGIIATHGMTFENVFFNLVEDRSFFMQKFTTAFVSGTRVTQGIPLIFVNCHFRGDVTIANLFQMEEDECSVILMNCTFSDNITNIFDDQRSDKVSYSITNINGTVIPIANMPAPTYNNMNPDLPLTHGLVTSAYHLNLGQGYRSPIVVPPNTVAYQPTGLTAVKDVGSPSDTIDLAWTAPSDNGGEAITGYKIERHLGSWSTIVADTGDTNLTYEDSTLSGGNQYYYRISAINSLGAGAPSDSANDTTDPLAIDAFTGISIDYDQMVFAGGQDTDLVSAVNRGSFGAVVTPAYTNDPTNDLANSALQFTKADAEAINCAHTTMGSTITVGMVLYLPANSSTRHLCRVPREIRIGSTEEITMNNVDTGVSLAEDTWQAVRMVMAPTGQSYVQINKGSKNSVTMNNAAVGFSGTVNIGAKNNTTNTLEGSIKFFGLQNGTITDNEWDAIVDEYII